MADTYKLQYNGMTLAYPGCGGYVSYEYSPRPQYTYTAEFVGNAPSYMSTSNTSDSIELQPNTYNIQYSAHFVLAQANRYNCQIGLLKSTVPTAYNYISSSTYSAVSENTKIVDISGTLEIDTSIGYDRFYLLRDSNNIFGNVSATITAQYYV